jgi:non-ribosomal peptide synthetase component F
MIEHGSFCTSVEDHGPPLGISAEARVLQFANYTFDACVMEIISTLMLGGCVCIPSSKQRMNDLSGAIRSMRVNWAVLTPSVASTIQPQDVPDLKTLVTAGEAQTPSLISTWGKHCRLINAYGKRSNFPRSVRG